MVAIVQEGMLHGGNGYGIAVESPISDVYLLAISIACCGLTRISGGNHYHACGFVQQFLSS